MCFEKVYSPGMVKINAILTVCLVVATVFANKLAAGCAACQYHASVSIN